MAESTSTLNGADIPASRTAHVGQRPRGYRPPRQARLYAVPPGNQGVRLAMGNLEFPGNEGAVAHELPSGQALTRLGSFRACLYRTVINTASVTHKVRGR